MTVKQWIIGGVRTGVQRLVAIGVGAATAWLAAKGFDLQIDPESIGLLAAIDVTVTAAVTAGLLRLETRFPAITKWLSLGLTQSGPTYDNQA